MADDSQSAQSVKTQNPAEIFLAMPKERQQTLLKTMPQAKKNYLYQQIKAMPSKAKQPEQSLRQKTDQYLNPPASAPMAERIAKGVARVPVGIAESIYDVSKPPETKTEKAIGWMPGALAVKRAVVEPGIEQFHKAVEDYDKGHYSEMLGHGAAGMIPLAGPWAASMGERAGKGDIAGTVSELITGLAAPKIVEKVLPTVDKLNDRAAKLSAKVYKNADATKKGMGLAVPLQAAQEGIIGSFKSLGEKVEASRLAKHTERLKTLDQATKSGVTIDVSQDVKPVLDRIKQAKSQAGTLDAKTLQEVNSFVPKLTQQTLPNGMLIPRDLTKLTPNEVHAMTSQIEGEQGLLSYDPDSPKAIQNVKNELRQKFLNKLDNQLPQSGRLRVEESRLMQNRDAIRKQYEAVLNDKGGMGRGIIYKDIGPMGLYFGIKALGLGMMAPVLGTIAMYKALASPLSRTLRAALYAKAAKLLDAHVAALQGPTGPKGASGAQTAIVPKRGPQVPPAQGVTGAAMLPAATGTHAPFAPVTSIHTNPGPTPLTRGTMLPESATRARVGSGDYVKKSVSSVDASPTAKASPDVSVAKSNTKSPVEKEARIQAAKDRLGEILDSDPKTPMQASQWKKEAETLKRLIRNEAGSGEVAKILKRKSDRERIASQRAESAKTAPQATVSSTGDVVSPAASPEQRSLVLEQGYKHIASMLGSEGPQVVKGLQKLAQDMRKIDPSYDEVTKLAEAIDALNAVKDLPKD